MLPAPLSRDEEIQLAIAARAGCLVSRRRLVASQLRFIYSIAMRTQTRAVPADEIAAELVLVVTRAVADYDPHAARFTTYLFRWLRGAAIECRKRLRAVVRRADIADSLDAPVSRESTETELDRLQADVEGADIELVGSERRASVRAAVASLTPAQRAVIEARYLSVDPEPVDTLAARLRVSPSTVAKHELLALRRLTALLRADAAPRHAT